MFCIHIQICGKKFLNSAQCDQNVKVAIGITSYSFIKLEIKSKCCTFLINSVGQVFHANTTFTRKIIRVVCCSENNTFNRSGIINESHFFMYTNEWFTIGPGTCIKKVNGISYFVFM